MEEHRIPTSTVDPPELITKVGSPMATGTLPFLPMDTSQRLSLVTPILFIRSGSRVTWFVLTEPQVKLFTFNRNRQKERIMSVSTGMHQFW